MTKRCSILLLLAACPSAPQRTEQPQQPPPPPPPTRVDFEVHGEVTGGGSTEPATFTKDQPPYVKLKLGHYKNRQYNVGLVIDLITDATEDVADIDPAKLRFDGDEKIWRLEGRHGSHGRIDYVREKDRVMLQITRDGRATVYIPDPGDRPSV